MKVHDLSITVHRNSHIGYAFVPNPAWTYTCHCGMFHSIDSSGEIQSCVEVSSGVVRFYEDGESVELFELRCVGCKCVVPPPGLIQQQFNIPGLIEGEFSGVTSLEELVRANLSQVVELEQGEGLSRIFGLISEVAYTDEGLYRVSGQITCIEVTAVAPPDPIYSDTN